MFEIILVENYEDNAHYEETTKKSEKLQIKPYVTIQNCPNETKNDMAASDGGKHKNCCSLLAVAATMAHQKCMIQQID